MDGSPELVPVTHSETHNSFIKTTSVLKSNFIWSKNEVSYRLYKLGLKSEELKKLRAVRHKWMTCASID